jgi:hypothetical protein
MEAHRVNGTWEIVKLPPGNHAIGSRWFLVKHNADGSLDCYKGRVVAKGYSQQPGFDFKETFAPTVRYSTICTILGICRLIKSLYGLKQAGRVWNRTHHAVLTSMGFSRIQSIVKDLSQHFKLHDLGPTTSALRS